MSDQVTLFNDAALAVLDGMTCDPDATCFYEHLSGGFIWSDEFPKPFTPDWTTVSHDYLHRYLVQFRRRITLGLADAKELPLWQQVLANAPSWPGLAIERRAGRIVKRLLAAERAAKSCYDKLEQEWAERDGES